MKAKLINGFVIFVYLYYENIHIYTKKRGFNRDKICW